MAWRIDYTFELELRSQREANPSLDDGKNDSRNLNIWPIFFCSYRWEKNGKPYDWQVYDDRISQQPGRGTLVITSPRDEDIGECSH